MDLVTRAQWGAKPSKYKLVWVTRTKGVKVHYEGAHVPESLANPDQHSKCDDHMRALQASHMANTEQNYSDIAYNFAVCPHGTVYEGRGVHYLTGANGSQSLNYAHYSVLGFVGNKGLVTPTPAMLGGIRDAIELCRSKGAAADEILGHRDGYNTTCPGEPLYLWVKKGAPRPSGNKPTPPKNPPATPDKPVGVRGSLGAWPGNPPVQYGRTNGHVQKLQLRLRAALGITQARRLNPNGATGYYGNETKAMVKYALRDHPETWDKGETSHDGVVGSKSWSVIDKL
ncbi:N-acetylmuramoyl-L-alanine amidase [Streptomyces wedmorensis]